MVDNISSEFIKILSAESLYPELTDSARKFILDQILSGEVLRIFPDGRAQIRLEGQTLVANPGYPLVAGQSLTAKVEQLSPTTILKLLEPSKVDQTMTQIPMDPKSDQPIIRQNPVDPKRDRTTISRDFKGHGLDVHSREL